jgi:hypothetical protein
MNIGLIEPENANIGDSENQEEIWLKIKEGNLSLIFSRQYLIFEVSCSPLNALFAMLQLMYQWWQS